METPETTTTCSRHPKVETGLRCATCGVLICPKCLVQTPVGAKCRDCASQRGNALFTPSPFRAAAAAVAAMAMGAIAGWGVEFLGGFLGVFLAFAYGGLAGEAILRASGRKRGLKMEIITGVAMTGGAIVGRMAVAGIMLSSPGHVRPPLGLLAVMVDLVQPSPVPLVALVVAIVGAVSRIRYI